MCPKEPLVIAVARFFTDHNLAISVKALFTCENNFLAVGDAVDVRCSTAERGISVKSAC